MKKSEANAVMKDVKNNELFIAKKIKEICDAENINYFLMYGTLLGAVRHDGFIPWDDDIDIGMKREDYEKFVKVFYKYADKSTFFLENWDTEKGFPLSFTKVKLNNTLFLENSIKNAYVHKGIYVDIFPFDKIDSRKKTTVSSRLRFYYNVLKFKKNYSPTNPDNRKQLILSKFIKFFSFLFPTTFLKKRIKRLETKFNGSNVTDYCFMGSPYKFKDIIPAKYLEQFENHSFDGVEFKIPRGYDGILKIIYGDDYMKLPPVEQRISRHFPKNIKTRDCVHFPIRILHSVSNMDRAGIETMLMNYYRNIDRETVQFDFLCNKKKPGAYDEEIKQLGANMYVSPGFNPIKYLKYLKFMKMLFVEHPEYRVVHSHNGAFAVYPLLAAKINKIPVRIFHAHGTSIIKDIKYVWKKVCMLFLGSTLNQRWTCGIEAARFYYGDKVVENEEYRLITNAINVERFLFNEKTRKSFRKKYDLEGKFVIGHVGRFMTQKNHTFLIDAFKEAVKQIPDAKLVLLGDGVLMEEIKQKVADYKLENNVLFVGNVNNVYEWYQAFDMFILPSIYEGLPVVGIEAQTAGLPCIFSSEVTKEVDISHESKFLNLEDDINVWASEINRLYLNYINTKDIVGKRTDKYEMVTNSNYNIKIEANKLQEVYLNLYNKGE